MTASLRLDDQLCFSLYTASRLVTRAYAPLLADLGLTYPQYTAMLALWEAGTPLTVGELGARLHMENGTLTPLLKRLETAGLIDRVRDSADERRVLLTLTPAGTQLRARACDIPGSISRRYGGDPERIAALKQVLDLLVDTLDRE
ncbi:MarR family winged helix-turn-helix transcriptional regulator [Actinoplanes sp. RD1]|uniref:MarR family winged helix-turn-helix transcriptional regulator n=1 Tax=Actinoplanes sp. RD1 TaxID=3064538 RepID=UPI002740B816|nr:MarR family transcriptional regulator [Actinoplanes sp. RD1]